MCEGARTAAGEGLSELLLACDLLDGNSRKPFGRLPVQLPESALEARKQARPQHHSLVRFPAPPSPCQLLCGIARAMPPWAEVTLAQTALMVSTADEVGWVAMEGEGGGAWVLLVQCTSGGSAASSRLYPLFTQELDRFVRRHYLADAPVERVVLCPDCRTEKRAEVGQVAYAECLRAFCAGERVVLCPLRPSLHRLALCDVAPDIRLTQTPLIAKVDAVKARDTAAASSGKQTRARLGHHLVTVAVLDMDKKMKYSDADPYQTLYLLCELRHPNVVRVLGALQPSPQQQQLSAVMPAAETVTLEAALSARSELLVFSPALQSKVALHVARGMQFLHAHGVVHGSLRPDRVCFDTHTDSGRVLVPVDALDDDESWRFQPPEQLRGTARGSAAGDVYAYGMLLYVWAVAGAFSVWKLPFGAKASRDEWRKDAKIEKICDEGLRPVMPSDTAEAVLQLAHRCWDGEPERRGSFEDVLLALGDARPAAPAKLQRGAAAAAAAAKKVAFSTRTLCDVGETIICMNLVHGRFVWISTSRPRIAVFDLQDDSLKSEGIAPTAVIQTLRWMPASDTVWAGAMDGTLFVWRVANCSAAPLSSRQHNNSVTAICVLDHDRVITADLTGDLVVWRSAVRDELRKLAPVASCGQPVRSMEVVKHNKAHLLVAVANAVILFDCQNSVYTQLFAFKHPGMSVASILLHKNALWVAGGTGVHVFDYEGRELRHERKNTSKSKIISLVLLQGLHSVPCTVSVNSTLDLFDDADGAVTVTDSLFDEKLTGKFNSSAFLLGRNEIVIARDSTVVMWKIAV